MCHRITLIEFHLCTKFGVNSSKFPRTGGPLLNKLFRSWRAQPAPLRHGNHKSIYAGEAYMLPGSLGLAARTVWPVGAAKELQVQNICTCTARAQCSPPLRSYGAKKALSRCTHVPSLVSLAQNFLKPKDPWSKRFFAPGACNLHPTQMAPPTDFKLVRYACDLRVWDRWRHPCAPQDRENMMRSKHLRVHCTCTMHPRTLLHTAPSRA